MDKEKIEKKLREATLDVREVNRRRHSLYFKKLSKYSQQLIEEEYKEAISKQMDLIEKLTELDLPEDEALKIVNRATK